MHDFVRECYNYPHFELDQLKINKKTHFPGSSFRRHCGLETRSSPPTVKLVMVAFCSHERILRKSLPNHSPRALKKGYHRCKKLVPMVKTLRRLSSCKVWNFVTSTLAEITPTFRYRLVTVWQMHRCWSLHTRMTFRGSKDSEFYFFSIFYWLGSTECSIGRSLEPNSN